MHTILILASICCLLVYLISLIEIIGSYFISSKEHNVVSIFYLMVGIFTPLTPLIAIAIYASAKELYDSNQKNTTEIDESFFGFVFHGFKTINQWAEK